MRMKDRLTRVEERKEERSILSAAVCCRPAQLKRIARSGKSLDGLRKTSDPAAELQKPQSSFYGPAAGTFEVIRSLAINQPTDRPTDRPRK